MKQTLINFVFYTCARLLHATYRYRYHGLEKREQAERHTAKKAVAVGLWHRNSFVGTLAHTYQNFSPLCSRSPDGQMVAFLCKHMGLRPVSGSSSRGGKEARSELVDHVDKGISPAITVDGPKGPPLQAKNGIIDIAKKTGIAILPTTAIADRYWELRSWDRLRIPKPFARVVINYADPLFVAPDAEGEAFEAIRANLDASLKTLDSETETLLKTAFASGTPLAIVRSRS